MGQIIRNGYTGTIIKNGIIYSGASGIEVDLEGTLNYQLREGATWKYVTADLSDVLLLRVYCAGLDMNYYIDPNDLPLYTNTDVYVTVCRYQNKDCNMSRTTTGYRISINGSAYDVDVYFVPKDGSGEAKPTVYDNLVFNNANAANLPYTIDSDYEIEVDFTVPNYINNMPVIGNSGSSRNLHLTQYNNKWYSSNGTAEFNFTASTTGRHTYVINRNGKCLFDNTEVGDYTPTTIATTYLTVAWRADTNAKLTGTIHEYKIKSISTGNLIADYVPAKITSKYLGDRIGLYDRINDTFVECGTSISND